MVAVESSSESLVSPPEDVPAPPAKPNRGEKLANLHHSQATLGRLLTEASSEAERARLTKSLREVEQQIEQGGVGAPPAIEETHQPAVPTAKVGDQTLLSRAEAAPAAESKQKRPEAITAEDRRAIQQQLRELYQKVERGSSGDEALQLAKQVAHLKRAGLEINPKDREKVFTALRGQLEHYRDVEHPLKLAQYLTYLKYAGASETLDPEDQQRLQFAISSQIDRGDATNLSQLCMYAKYVGAQTNFEAAQPVLQADFVRTQQAGEPTRTAFELARRKYLDLAYTTTQPSPADKTTEGFQAAAEGTVDRTLDSLGVNEHLGQLRQDRRWREFAHLRVAVDYMRGPRPLQDETQEAMTTAVRRFAKHARHSGDWAPCVAYIGDLRKLSRQSREVTPNELTDLTREEIEQQTAAWVQGDRPVPDPENVLDTPVVPLAGDTDVRAGETAPLPPLETTPPEVAPLTEVPASARSAEHVAPRRADQGSSVPAPVSFSVTATPRVGEVSAVPTLGATSAARPGMLARLRGWFKNRVAARGDASRVEAAAGVETPAVIAAAEAPVEHVSAANQSVAAAEEVVPESRWPREVVEEWTAEQQQDFLEELQSNFEYTSLRSVTWSLYEDIRYYQEQGKTFEEWLQDEAAVVHHMEEHDLPPAEAWVLIESRRGQ